VELGYEPRRSYEDALAETRRFLIQRGLLPEPATTPDVEGRDIPTPP
jgi:hypothetical protein